MHRVTLCQATLATDTIVHMSLVDALTRDNVSFSQAEFPGIDVKKARKVTVRSNERAGAPEYRIDYDYLVIALQTACVIVPGPGEERQTVQARPDLEVEKEDSLRAD